MFRCFLFRKIVDTKYVSQKIIKIDEYEIYFKCRIERRNTRLDAFALKCSIDSFTAAFL